MSKHRRRQRNWAWLIAPLLLLGLIPAGFAMASGHGTSNLTRHPDCTLKVPDHPLTAAGLATPYELGSAGIACSETDNATAAFVQATIYDPATGQLSVYNPVVKDAGQALLGTAPPVPTLPHDAVVSIWTGFNANTLKLVGPGHDRFVNFAQQAYANSGNFFGAVNRGISHGALAVPPLGTSPVDGKACPSTRDFSIVDQDQSDNNVEAYTAYGVSNGSDEGTNRYVARSLGCSIWTVPNLSAPGTVTTSAQMEEIQASVYQGAPIALVPGGDPFVLTIHGHLSLGLLNLYRAQVDQPFTGNIHDTAAYCANLAGPSGEGRLKADASFEGTVSSSNGTGTNLANQLAGRFAATWANLNCQGLTGMASPITVTTDSNGVFNSATYA
jgi:hypothetical protein